MANTYLAVDFIFDQLINLWNIIYNNWILAFPIAIGVLTLVSDLVKQARGE